MRRLIVASVAALIAGVVTAVPAAADPGHGHGTTATGAVGETINDFGPDDAGLPLTAPDGMSNTYLDALLVPEPSGPRECKLVRNDRTDTGPPPNASEQQIVYFRPSDAINYTWDSPAVCSDGVKRESNIGYSNHNTRRWTGTQTTQQGKRLAGKAYKVNLRTVYAYSRSFTFVNVMHVQGWYNTAYYGTDTYTRLTNEFNARGWNHVNVKYVVYAELKAMTQTSSGTSPIGQAQFNGNKGFSYRQFQRSDGTVRKARWGCADEGDAAPIHEATHSMGAVAQGAADYYYTSEPGKQNHVTQAYDLMSPAPASSFSGRSSSDQPYPYGPLEWDQGSDSYTSRVLSFPAYFTNSPISGLHLCE